MKLFLLLSLTSILGLSQKTRLWTVYQQQPSQLLQTINTTFYPNIDIEIGTNITEVLENCDTGCNVLYTASNNNNYPNALNPISMNDYSIIMNKSINIYIEYPSCIQINSNTCQTFTIKNTLKAEYERAVTVSSNLLTPLKNFTIIDLHEVTWINIRSIQTSLAKNDLLMIAKVAGYDYALYQFTNTTVYPLLYESNNTIISLTSLSDYSIARYVPFENIKIVLTFIINKLMNSTLNPSQISWISNAVQPSINIEGTIDIEQSFQRGIDWIFNSKLLVDKYIQVHGNKGQRLTPSPTAISGDGTIGLFEGFSSAVNSSGGQDQSVIIRTDCQGEIAGSLAWSGYIFNNEYHMNISYNLLNFIYNTSIAQQGERNDVNSSEYGLLIWGVNAGGWNSTVYCDDNARAILSTMMAMALLHDNKYNINADRFVANVVRAILGNFRLTSRKGFCQNRETMSALNKNGWEYYFNGSYELDDPHYESWIWCSYLFTYHITGYEVMYERTVTGMEHIMNAYYAGKLHWANGLTQEYSRLLLPLSFLNKIENKSNATHLKWLMDIGNQLKIYFINGTIEEHYGDLKYGNAKPPQSNVQYGTTEAPLEQENGDPVSDSLYTLPFAMWGLHEAYLLTNDYEIFGQVLSNLTQYLINIQAIVDTKDIQYSYLNGSWFRGFDFNRGEYFASASDIGWGPYSIESGWTVGEILSSFAMIMTNNSFFDIVNGDTLYNFGQYVKQYVPIFGLPPF